MLGDVSHGNDQQRARNVDAPSVVPLQVRLLGGQIKPHIREPAQPLAVALDH